MPHEAKVLLEDVRLAVQDIEEFTRGRSLTDYQSDRILRAAVERMFIVIGEALSRLERLDANIAGQITNYRKIVGFRNVLVHGYEMIDASLVWKTLENHMPILRCEVESLATQLAGGP